jgi:hypothetical protein
MGSSAQVACPQRLCKGIRHEKEAYKGRGGLMTGRKLLLF